MAVWGFIAGLYGVVLAAASLALPIRRRHVAFTAAVAYALVGVGAGTLADTTWVHVVVPGLLLLAGYWLSGFFFRDPQAWLERWLLATDGRVFAALRINERLRRAPGWLLEGLELVYAADYVVVGGGAILAGASGAIAAESYWSLVLGAELACYGALPWLRSRPPRTIEGAGVMSQRTLALRRLNETILDRASVQANTLPSGHVAGATAAALGLLSVNPVAASILLIVSLLIGVAAVVGRYHYIVDCVTGAAVAVALWMWL